METKPTLKEIFGNFLNDRLKIMGLEPILEWTPSTFIGLWKVGSTNVWVRFYFKEEPRSAGLYHEARIQFTLNEKLKKDQFNCPLLWTIQGEESNVGNERTFKFTHLPRGSHQGIKTDQLIELKIISEIANHFVETWRKFDHQITVEK